MWQNRRAQWVWSCAHEIVYVIPLFSSPLLYSLRNLDWSVTKITRQLIQANTVQSMSISSQRTLIHGPFKRTCMYFDVGITFLRWRDYQVYVPFKDMMIKNSHWYVKYGCLNFRCTNPHADGPTDGEGFKRPLPITPSILPGRWYWQLSLPFYSLIPCVDFFFSFVANNQDNSQTCVIVMNM